MAAPMRQILTSNFSRKLAHKLVGRASVPVRTLRWDARLIEELWEKPDGAQTLAEVKKERFPEPDQEVYSEVNIGFPIPDAVKKAANRVRISRKKSALNPELERLARTRELRVPLDEVQAAWRLEKGPYHVCDIAKHYGVFRDLFGLAYFYPVVDLDVSHAVDDESRMPIYRGNVIEPIIASSAPEVTYSADAGSLWTLVMTSPDEHLTIQDKEYLHWMVGNIPEQRVSEGELLCEYMPPIPPRGTGRHRYVFLLYKQQDRIDFSHYKRPRKCSSLSERTFDTYSFYKQHQAVMTPAGLAFYQAEWDEAVTATFRDFLDMKEPSYEYDWPPDHRPAQENVPHRKQFNLYMDKYRDVKEINEEVLKEKFRNLNPFKPFPKKAEHPNIFFIPDHVPFWKKEEMVRRRFREEKYKILEEGK